MFKSDLKDGMVVTYRNKAERVFLKGNLYENENSLYSLASSLDHYSEVLTIELDRDLDIIKVEYMGQLLWERIEETPEQKEIKRLQGIIEDAQAALKAVEEQQ